MPKAKKPRLSTTQVSKKLDIPTRDAFARLIDLGLIVREDDAWSLTDSGRETGADYKVSEKTGRYIVWPERVVDLIKDTDVGDTQLLKASDLAKEFGLSAARINKILSELGWIDKQEEGWTLTPQGQRVGGIQKKTKKSGECYAVWPRAVLENKTLVKNIKQLQGEEPNENRNDLVDGVKAAAKGLRDKFEARHRTTDGHYVRSKAEMLIDNWLYMAEIVHAYERKLPIEEDIYCDFYIPAGKVYIEYWGYSDDAMYLMRKERKQAIYKKYGFKLIELQDKDVQNLDDVLPQRLLECGVGVG